MKKATNSPTSVSKRNRQDKDSSNVVGVRFLSSPMLPHEEETERKYPDMSSEKSEVRRSGDIASVTCSIIEILSSSEEDDTESCTSCNDTAKATQEIQMKDNQGHSGSMKAKEGLKSSGFSFQKSAYVQNLAEICNDIVHDARWRVSNKRLFQWELGDDLSVLNSFSRLYDDDDDDGGGGDEERKTSDESEDFNHRCIHLYARLFHRKGPWFNILDIFVRYYQWGYERKRVVEEKCVSDGACLEQEADDKNCNMNKLSWDTLETRLCDCISDINKLISMGFLRTFTSEEECGRVVGDPNSRILTQKKKLEILRALGGRPSKVSGDPDNTELRNDILMQMKRQRTLLFHVTSEGNCLLPVVHHVDNIIFEALAKKVNTIVIDQDTLKSTQDIKRLWRSISSDDDLSVCTCLRLREAPLQTLRRACRLYLCAGDGAGSMRWSGTNGWLTVNEKNEGLTQVRPMKEKKILKGICTLPDPPITDTWHRVVFPGLNYRMGLANFCLTQNFERCSNAVITSEKMIEVFHDQESFLAWEVTAELRCNIDYLNEWNRLVLYSTRKMKRSGEGDEEISRKIAQLTPQLKSEFDVLSMDGRLNICRRLLRNHEALSDVNEQVEEIIRGLHHSRSEEHPLRDDDEDAFVSDAERMICAIGVVCRQVLLHRLKLLSNTEALSLIKRPWLRHLRSESALAYIIWDCIDVLEKRKYYRLACRMLETILFGCEVKKTQCAFADYHQNSTSTEVTNFIQLLLSRRVRGKAFMRLVIDKKHQRQKSAPSKKKRKMAQKESDVDSFASSSLPSIVKTGSLPFCFIRKLSRRIKIPLTSIISEACSVEVKELGIRLMNSPNSQYRGGVKEKEWTPTIDTAIANPIPNDSQIGNIKRCAFVGDDDNGGLAYVRSLNVEELAIVEYASGRLPVDVSRGQDPLKCTSAVHGGGWKGWHAEGFHVRALFRILCMEPLLGYNFDCDAKHSSTLRIEQKTIFLHRYQGVPLDLHVAHVILQGDGGSAKAARSFYERRRNYLQSFLFSLQAMSPQQLSDLVHTTIINKKDRAESRGIKLSGNQSIYRDLQDIKILSMIGERKTRCCFNE